MDFRVTTHFGRIGPLQKYSTSNSHLSSLSKSNKSKKLLIPEGTRSSISRYHPTLAKGPLDKGTGITSDTSFQLTGKNRPSLLEFVQPAAREGTSPTTTHRRVFSRDSSSLKGNNSLLFSVFAFIEFIKLSNIIYNPNCFVNLFLFFKFQHILHLCWRLGRKAPAHECGLYRCLS